jgi:hypothetical protein
VVIGQGNGTTGAIAATNIVVVSSSKITARPAEEPRPAPGTRSSPRPEGRAPLTRVPCSLTSRSCRYG